MVQATKCDGKTSYSEVITAASELLTQSQWLVLQNKAESQGSIAAVLGVARARVRYIQSKALDKIRQSFSEEIACFSKRIDELAVIEGEALTITKCLAAFPELNEDELRSLLTVSHHKIKLQDAKNMNTKPTLTNTPK